MSQRICSVEGCDKSNYGHGRCKVHWKQWRDLTEKRVCSVGGCNGRLKSRGWCGKHYMRWWEHGDPNWSQPTPFERWAAKVSDRDDPNACWEWQACQMENGYGKFLVTGRLVLAHRFAYEHFVGPIPDGMEIDHRCRNRPCVNPAHLRLVTPKQNREHQGLSPRNTSGYRGVYRQRSKWVARAKHHGVHYSAGTYDTPEEANEAAMALRNRLFTHNDLDRRDDGRQGSTGEPRMAS